MMSIRNHHGDSFQRGVVALSSVVGAVHLWPIDIAKVADVHEPEALLSPAESARAARFRFSKDRIRYIVRTAMLRQILSRYLNIAPTRMSFNYGEFGKPFLDSRRLNPEIRNLHFNLSHSDDAALIAISGAGPIGIDVERIRGNMNIDGLAAHCFTSEERSALEPLQGDAAVDLFFRLWTAKEAYVKAIGRGLSQNPQSVQISVNVDSTVTLVTVNDDREEASRWRLHSFSPQPGYLATLAAPLGVLPDVMKSFPQRAGECPRCSPGFQGLPRGLRASDHGKRIESPESGKFAMCDAQTGTRRE